MSGRKERDHDDRRNYIVDVLVDMRIRLANGEPEQDHSPDPTNSSNNVVCKIARILHACGACYRRTESPNNGHEARQDNGLTSITFIEFVSPGKMARLEESGILAAE